MSERIYCSIRGGDALNADEARRCVYYDSICKYQTGCLVLQRLEPEPCSARTPQPGDRITASTTRQSLRNLRMRDGR